jgi:hypothetical protein
MSGNLYKNARQIGQKKGKWRLYQPYFGANLWKKFTKIRIFVQNGKIMLD